MTILMTMRQRSMEWTTRLNRGLARALAWVLLAMVLAQFTSVVLRYAFATGSIWLQESVLYMHATLFLLFAAGALIADAHVRVDIWYRQYSAAHRARVNLWGALVFAIPVCAFIFYTSLDYVALAWRVQEGSRETSGLQAVYLLKTLLLVFAVSLGAQAGVLALRSWKSQLPSS